MKFDWFQNRVESNLSEYESLSEKIDNLGPKTCVKTINFDPELIQVLRSTECVAISRPPAPNPLGPTRLSNFIHVYGLLIKIRNNKQKCQTPFQMSTHILQSHVTDTNWTCRVENIQHLYKVSERPHDIARLAFWYPTVSAFLLLLCLFPMSAKDFQLS